ncbi:hypothetical protein P167DRAFT_168489 [Morchella conica CCBAS932]|uniref:Uncharacterized protein n=1 Tax=Morchella conica CCBAS932 TaxID=1392247 RepID=A0A3N4KNT0_9PEZI|nr:hypothetical protein P167DRAFT_168489 [Morchella conica CCBAS932]
MHASIMNDNVWISRRGVKCACVCVWCVCCVYHVSSYRAARKVSIISIDRPNYQPNPTLHPSLHATKVPTHPPNQQTTLCDISVVTSRTGKYIQNIDRQNTNKLNFFLITRQQKPDPKIE